MSVEAYLDEAYKQIKENESSNIKKFIIHCKSHVLKSFKQKMPSHPKIKRFFLNALKMMMSFKIYANFLFALESFFLVTLSVNECQCVKDSVKFLSSKREDNVVESEEDSKNFEDTEENDSSNAFKTDISNIFAAISESVAEKNC